MLNETNVQDWTREKQLALRDAILAQYGFSLEEINDVAVRGGRVIGWARADSDIDTCVYIDEYQRPDDATYKQTYYFDFEGMAVSTTVEPSDWITGRPHNTFRLPRYLINADDVVNVFQEDIQGWANFKRTQDENFFQDRNTGRFIVDIDTDGDGVADILAEEK